MPLNDFENHRESGNHKGKCVYLLSQIKQLDKKVWHDLKERYSEVDIDESWEFYQKLIYVYKKMDQKIV